MNATAFIFNILLLANPTQTLLAKNPHDHEMVFNSKLYDPKNPVRVSLTGNQNLKSHREKLEPEALIRKRNHQTSIQLANDVAYGLAIAQDKGEIKYGTKTYRKVQTAIALLRRGAGLEDASRRSGLPRSILDQLMQWGQQRPGALVEHILD
ncbi:hypothetical protein [Gloeothece citriformis]|uniref:hypothetical protein n=1 Tax=Gloeothece citriformis TaxID=2546356 RepID=UPI0002D7C625|nr:hypothetical protein [Gloeothece citriformis]